MTLGSRLRQLRNEKELSQPDLAERIGIEQSYLSKLENDKSLPSNDILRKILSVFNLTIATFLSTFDESYVKTHLVQIPDIEQFVKHQQTQHFIHRKRWLLVSSAVIAIASMLFFVGYNKEVFNEVLYRYESLGIVKKGEPEQLFENWHKITKETSAKTTAFHNDIKMRLNTHYIETRDYRGKLFVVDVEGGVRTYTLDRTQALPQLINGILKALGILLWVLGIMGFVIERKMSR